MACFDGSISFSEEARPVTHARERKSYTNTPRPTIELKRKKEQSYTTERQETCPNTKHQARERASRPKTACSAPPPPLQRDIGPVFFASLSTAVHTSYCEKRGGILCSAANYRLLSRQYCSQACTHACMQAQENPQPHLEALWSGVLSSLSLESTSAPFTSNARAML